MTEKVPPQIQYLNPGEWVEKGGYYLTVWAQNFEHGRIEGFESGWSSQWYDLPKTWACT